MSHRALDAQNGQASSIFSVLRRLWILRSCDDSSHDLSIHSTDDVGGPAGGGHFVGLPPSAENPSYATEFTTSIRVLYTKSLCPKCSNFSRNKKNSREPYEIYIFPKTVPTKITFTFLIQIMRQTDGRKELPWQLAYTRNSMHAVARKGRPFTRAEH